MPNGINSTQIFNIPADQTERHIRLWIRESIADGYSEWSKKPFNTKILFEEATTI
jgi:hypothetical protein